MTLHWVGRMEYVVQHDLHTTGKAEAGVGVPVVTTPIED